LALLREVVSATYAQADADRGDEYIFAQGRSAAIALGYATDELAHVPHNAVQGFAGVANPFSLGPVAPGETVLDLGCGTGTDLLIAARMARSTGRAIGIDMTPILAERARAAAGEAGLANVEVLEARIEQLPVRDHSIDLVIANAVIDLVPDKDAVLREIRRVLCVGGRMQVAELVVRHPTLEQYARHHTIPGGPIVGALLFGEHARRLKSAGFIKVRQRLATGGQAARDSDGARTVADRLRDLGIDVRALTIRAAKPALSVGR
jgi:ubiquinone/menaquinone biosynthesis C-methylase UbiE